MQQTLRKSQPYNSTKEWGKHEQKTNLETRKESHESKNNIPVHCQIGSKVHRHSRRKYSKQCIVGKRHTNILVCIAWEKGHNRAAKERNSSRVAVELQQKQQIEAAKAA